MLIEPAGRGKIDAPSFARRKIRKRYASGSPAGNFFPGFLREGIRFLCSRHRPPYLRQISRHMGVMRGEHSHSHC